MKDAGWLVSYENKPSGHFLIEPTPIGAAILRNLHNRFGDVGIGLEADEVIALYVIIMEFNPPIHN